MTVSIKNARSRRRRRRRIQDSGRFFWMPLWILVACGGFWGAPPAPSSVTPAPWWRAVVVLLPVQAAHSRRRRSSVLTMMGLRGSSSDRMYDRSVTTFDPTGRLRQVEHGWTAAERGQTVAAAIVGDAIYVVVVPVAVLAAAAPTQSTMLTTHTSRSRSSSRRNYFPKVQPILAPSSSASLGTSSSSSRGAGLWCVTAGLVGDAQYWTDQLRSVTRQWHEDWFGIPISISQLARVAAERQHALTVTAGRRPLGVTALLMGYEQQQQQQQEEEATDASEPRLFRCSAGGILEDCRYCATGKHHAAVQAAVAECYDELLLLSETAVGSACWHYEIVERLVKAVHEGLGLKVNSTRGLWNKKWRADDNSNDEDRIEMSVWVFPKPLSFGQIGNHRGGTDDTNAGKHHQPICFSNIHDEDSLAKVKTFWMSQQAEEDTDGHSNSSS